MLPALLLVTSSLTLAASNNTDIILPPLSGSTGPEKLLIFIPGANVATEFYLSPIKEIQAKTKALRLWIVVPAIAGKKCIITCPTASLCAPLHSIVETAVGKAKGQGYEGASSAPDAFVAGHSMGGACASNLVQGYAQTPSNYSALVVMGSFVGGQDVLDYPTPVLTLGAELDGGAARPGALTRSLSSSDAAALAHGGVGSEYQLRQKPVTILQGLDHSSFCPGFKVRTLALARTLASMGTSTRLPPKPNGGSLNSH
jgi:pimeloyl-ACP methyl ester carboxylesterase